MRPARVPVDIVGPARIKGGPNLHLLEEFDRAIGLPKHYRALPGHHPLVKAWLGQKKITEKQFNAGNKYRVLYEKANDPHGVDSTQLLAINRSVGSDLPAGRGGDGLARRSIKLIERRLARANRAIIRNFCGLGIPMGASVQSVVNCNSAGYIFRLREALDDLVEAFENLSIPDLERDIEREIA